ncbi:hypothetical protein EKH57_13240 [Halorubrum sp. BOL3-1]|uniref:DUF7573 domain-containing protein n=1 Tax=Halorubrum sp. BOL3-1 TaxID=2497325 RepID=UPI0010050C53|nr:hypothetical protein [Halorubrum sp. BOL3-1]QAU13600.1 hypothetical protein EKH57_13240 [Halorubrum sp. BOL3-1]
MPEDRSLDDFAPDGDAETENGDTETDNPGSDAAAGDSDGVDPATATSTWHADGAECDRCGERVERRWRDGDALVCADCASW